MNFIPLFIALLFSTTSFALEGEEEFDLSGINFGTEEYDAEKFISLVLSLKRDSTKLIKLMRVLLSKGYFVNELEEWMLPIFVTSLNSEDPSIQLEAIKLTSALAQTKAEYIREDTVLYLIKLIHSKNETIIIEALRTLGIVIYENPKLRSVALKHKIDEHLLTFLDNENETTPIEILREISSVMKSICLKGDGLLSDKAFKRLIQAFEYFLTQHTFDSQIISNTTWAFALLMKNPTKDEYIIPENLLKIFVDSLSHDDSEIVLASISLIKNTADLSNPDQMEILFDFGIMEKVPTLLKHADDNIVSMTFLFLLHLSKDFQKHSSTTKMFETNIISSIIDNIEHNSFEIQDKATLIITYLLFQSTPKQVSNMMEMNVIQALCKVLHRVNKMKSEKDIQVILGAFNFINKKVRNRIEEFHEILETCGAMKILDQLKNHEDKTTKALAMKIIKAFNQVNDKERQIKNEL